MKSHKGFIVPLLLIIIAILVVGGGVYVYTQKKQANLPLPQAISTTPMTNQTTSIAQVSDLKTYTNYAFGFSIKIPFDNKVYTCEEDFLQPQIANEKSYSVFILENPTDIDLTKCDYSEISKYNHLTINARRQDPGEYSEFVENWKKVSGNGKYVIVKEISFAQHDALLKTKIESANNNNPYKEILINGGGIFLLYQS